MINLNLADQNFPNQASAVPNKSPRLVRWDRTCKTAAPLILTDWTAANAILPSTPGQYVWLLESPYSRAGWFARTKLTELEQHAELIFTSEIARVRDKPDKYRYAPVGGIWVEEPALRSKTKACSLIASTKTNTPAQRIRTTLAEELADVVDVFGRGRAREVARVEEALDDYRFSVVVENAEVAGYWTEKLLNCFATGTIPIYKGAPDIGRYFDERGIVQLTDNDTPFDLSNNYYKSLLPYARANLYEALRYEIPDDRLVVDHFTELL